MLLAGRHPLPGAIACLSGRVSFELVQKAALAQLAGVVAVGARPPLWRCSSPRSGGCCCVGSHARAPSTCTRAPTSFATDSIPARMEIVAFLVPFVLLGVAVVFIAFSGGPGAAREAYLTRGGRVFRIAIPLIYIVAGVVIPALILTNKGEAAGGVGALKSEELTAQTERGKDLFRQQCASCHTLAAVNARGVTGPNLDDIGEVTPKRILNAIKNGGTGQKRMPSGLLEGEEAQDVAKYVSEVAGRD